MNKNVDKNESKLFQLPSLPPWRTPRFNKVNLNNFTTPLRKRSTRVISNDSIPITGEVLEEKDVDEAYGMNMDVDEVDHLNSLSHIEEEKAYDYSPFCERNTLRESKIDSFLQAERAAHCLVFHKEGHLDCMDTYRPDIDVMCGEMTLGSDNPDSNGTMLLESVPGCSKEDLGRLSRREFVASSKPSMRRLDDIINHETNALSSFWNDSDLVSSLQSHHLHEEYLLLQEELKNICKTQCHNRVPIESLREKCRRHYNSEDSSSH
ncbi:anaphase promoting complex subunit 9 SKDI_12G1520 [Saccharomyces kudriavzevii IFO 1802]|uniref:APC9-like protein n=2 Tax=Saccharomyces kudriavzevii (strain ATCC MYA-4449 / AS 2.2408 / CBS 8840 / NBRC 1802 / NCYC 2889) TaxID=226230 RepID=J5RT37_SACK1|nr:uncharacterized protein SKDI_12G1520 [Saccharomyces kudriavzevii IFO 1802]EJT42661.1 APC9-like protein [Saccharomyces kudriavzevii IFO 1802]CAI4046038.1 hypothetical protein SKDI_12G1520 [Saccharomyces kudriavzevii IFO 1802]